MRQCWRWLIFSGGLKMQAMLDKARHQKLLKQVPSQSASGSTNMLQQNFHEDKNQTPFNIRKLISKICNTEVIYYTLNPL